MANRSPPPPQRLQADFLLPSRRHAPSQRLQRFLLRVTHSFDDDEADIFSSAFMPPTTPSPAPSPPAAAARPAASGAALAKAVVAPDGSAVSVTAPRPRAGLFSFDADDDVAEVVMGVCVGPGGGRPPRAVVVGRCGGARGGRAVLDGDNGA